MYHTRQTMVLLKRHGYMIYKKCKKVLEYLERKVNLQVQINIVIYIQTKIQKAQLKVLVLKMLKLK